MTARDVADRLGVEVSTVYAYASRGALTRRPAPDGRRSWYDADEVELLAQRGRPRSLRRRSGAVDVVIGTTVSEIGDGWIRYRGHDLVDLASWCTFEDACRLLWTGEVEGDSYDSPPLDPAMAATVQAVSAAMSSRATTGSRLAAGVAAASSWVPRATDERTAIHAGTLVLSAMVASLPTVGAVTGDERSVAEHLLPRISPLTPTPARRRALDTALVLMAEHELATSTLAARVAASTRARPAEVVLAGLGTMSGPFHGRAAVRVHRRLAEGLGPVDMSMLAGFGHIVHQRGDPRYGPLIDRARQIASGRRRRVIDAYVGPRDGAEPPNCDAALGALGFALDGDPGCTEAIFAIARTAGWLAHAYEEADEAPVRFRGRTVYRGRR